MTFKNLNKAGTVALASPHHASEIIKIFPSNF
jgi:hypothetical protein